MYLSFVLHILYISIFLNYSICIVKFSLYFFSFSAFFFIFEFCVFFHCIIITKVTLQILIIWEECNQIWNLNWILMKFRNFFEYFITFLSEEYKCILLYIFFLYVYSYKFFIISWYCSSFALRYIHTSEKKLFLECINIEGMPMDQFLGTSKNKSSLKRGFFLQGNPIFPYFFVCFD